MQKQISFIFFKYKYYLFQKTKQFNDNCFLYVNNYLSWNFYYFWYWYVFLYVSVFFRKSLDLTLDWTDSSNSSIAVTQNNVKKILYVSKIKDIFCYKYNNYYIFTLNKKKIKKYYIYFNFFFKILLKHIVRKNVKIYQKIYMCQIYSWKKQFYFYKKIYKNFSQKLQKQHILAKIKQHTHKKLNLRLKSNIRYLNMKYLNIFNTCGYYNYFKRKIFKKIRVYNFFFNFWKKNKNNYKDKYYGIISKIGVINIVVYLNNTYVTLTDLSGNVLFVCNGGIVGIKGPNRSTSVTSEEVTLSICNFLKKTSLKFLILKFSGVLYSRKIKAAFKVFTFQKNYKILRVFNNTPKSHNGIRLKKKKRL